MSAAETRQALRWLLGLLLLGITAVSGALVVALVALPEPAQHADTLATVALRVVAWCYLATGVLLALCLLLERRGARYLYVAWVAALTLLLASLARLWGGFGVVAGVLCAVVVWSLMAALDWATRAHAA